MPPEKMRVSNRKSAPLAKKSSSNADRAVLQSVQRAVRVLDAVSHAGIVTINELVAELELDRTIVYRLVRTLEREQLLEATHGGYKVGRQALMLGNAYIEHLPVVRVALPFQVGLLDRVLKGRPWTTSLLLPIGAELALIDTVWNVSAPLDIQLSLGRHFPLATTAVGHGILAYWPTDKVVDAIGTELATELEGEFEKIRQAGGLSFVRDFAPGVSAIGAIIFDRSKEPLAGLLLSGLELEDELTSDSSLARTMRRTADAISQALP
ncbi:MAG: IclR family transcriptional regulator [Acidimicrobiales bacterium]